MQSTGFNLTAYHKGPDGELFFGGVNGLNAFYPEAFGYSSLSLIGSGAPARAAPRIALGRVLFPGNF